MKEEFPLKKVDKDEMEEKLNEIAAAFSLLINKEISSIQSDVKRILDVVQVGSVDKADRQ